MSDMSEMEASVHGWVPVAKDEMRVIAYSNLECRMQENANGGNTLVGYAAVFDSPSEPLPYTEFVRRGAFAKTINDGADVRLLIDHTGVPLARTRSGTLNIEEDERGLLVEADLDPLNPDAARVISAMRRGDMSQMSFAFRSIKDSWNEDRSVRELKEVQLFDVSVVTFPAYEQTVAEVRSNAYTQDVMPIAPTRLRNAQVQLAKHRSR
jgi:HK97 family phage prohead protease